jgi:DNA topoisomerase-1
VNDGESGFRRVRSGARFRYLTPRGRAVREPRTLARIRSLAIPPAYREVWICRDPRGHIQATGRDARGRKQYRYHARWREVRDELKFDRMLAFSRALPEIRARVRRDLARRDLAREKVIAAIVRLLEETAIRVGNEEYAVANRSYGLTTLRNDHVEIEGESIVFEFRGKRGKQHRCRLRDRKLARVLARCRAIPGEELFQYVDGEGHRRSIGSEDVNAYLREISGEEFSAKDFRTWTGTLLAARALAASGGGRGSRERRRQLLEAIDAVALRLNNTRAVCRKFYVHPGVVEAFERGSLPAFFRRAAVRSSPTGLSAIERSLVAFLAHARRSRDRTASDAPGSRRREGRERRKRPDSESSRRVPRDPRRRRRPGSS